LGDLKRPRTLLVAVTSLLASGAITQIASCNVHELSHALVGTAVGWEVDRVFLCPGGAAVEYANTNDSWIGNAEGYAGGFGAAAFIVGVYWLVFVRRDRPLRSPGRWAAGLGVLAGAGAQLVIGALEGTGGVRGWDYNQMIDDHLIVWLPLIGASMVAAAAAHVWRWRAVWQSQGSE
jgi:hypothetical protein